MGGEWRDGGECEGRRDEGVMFVREETRMGDATCARRTRFMHMKALTPVFARSPHSPPFLVDWLDISVCVEIYTTQGFILCSSSSPSF